jgi:hypothetical protein
MSHKKRRNGMRYASMGGIDSDLKIFNDELSHTMNVSNISTER